MEREARAEARRFGRSAGMLSLGIGSAGLLTYLYFSLASHNLSRTDYGEIVVLWSAVFVPISVLFRPVEQLLSRTIAERQAHGQPIGSALRVAATIQLGLAAAFAVVALALRGPIQDDLLSGNETLYWILVTAVARLRGQLLRPRLPRRQPSLRALRGAAADGVDRPDVVRAGGRARDRQRADRGGARDHRRARSSA